MQEPEPPATSGTNTTADHASESNILPHGKDAEEVTGSEDGVHGESSAGVNYGWRFWMIILSLCFTSLLTAIEATVTATALPTIAGVLDSREIYVWFVNAIFLSRSVLVHVLDR